MGQQELKCPNCGSAVTVKADGTVVCATCGGSFTWQAGEPKLSNIGEIDALRRDVDELKRRLPASTPAAAPPEEPTEPDGMEDSDDDDAEEDL